MTYIDVSPMIAALRERPADFEMIRGSLYHLPSRHTLHFSAGGLAHIEAQCGCALHLITDIQSRQLYAAFVSWQESYWRGVEVNREFASHFKRPGFVARVWRAMVAGWREAGPAAA